MDELDQDPEPALVVIATGQVFLRIELEPGVWDYRAWDDGSTLRPGIETTPLVGSLAMSSGFRSLKEIQGIDPECGLVSFGVLGDLVHRSLDDVKVRKSWDRAPVGLCSEWNPFENI